MPSRTPLRVALAQLAPRILDREATLARVEETIHASAESGADLVTFGEAFVPGYPVWVERTDGALFEDEVGKELYALYADQAVTLEYGHLEGVSAAARSAGVAVLLGVIERPVDRGMSLFASSVFVDANGEILSVHRKLRPTHEERLTWAPGDGHGLRVHPLGSFRVGRLNCWENWMPLARASLYAQGETLHVMQWPGGLANTELITPFVAREGRNYVVSVSALLREQDFPTDLPHRARIVPEPGELLKNGGSCVAAPDGSWVQPPVLGEERLIVCELDPAVVQRARQSFDPAGHYARPDVLSLSVDRRRQTTARFEEGE